MPPILYIFQGPPATGKTTKRQQMIAADPTLRYVNKDELRELNPSASEGEIHETQLLLMEQWSHNAHSIIIDNTNLNPRTVQSYHSWAQKYGYTVVQVAFGADVPLDVAVMRDHQRGLMGGRTVGKSVIYQFYVDAGLLPVPVPAERPPLILIDIDGTAADVTHRRALLWPEGATKPDWKAWNAAMHLDTPHRPVQLVYQALTSVGHRVMFLSGRGSECRRLTEDWLMQHGYGVYEALIMRPFRDSRPDNVVKRELYERYVQPYWDVQLVLDDRDSVVQGWREMGLPCFQVAPGNF